MLLFLILTMETERKYFVTYGNEFYTQSKKRILEEAKYFKIFDECIGYEPNDLDSEFKKANYDILSKKRGAGYWIWKPYVVMKTLNKMNNGDILLYCDAGCTLHIKGMDRMNQYLDIVRKNNTGILGFQMEFVEKHWTKADLIQHLDAHKHIDSGQIMATTYFIRKCDKSMEFVRNWLELVQNTHFVDDSVSVLPNYIGFQEHRHDQSCFSLLSKLNNATILSDEQHSRNNKHPIWASRIRK